MVNYTFTYLLEQQNTWIHTIQLENVLVLVIKHIYVLLISKTFSSFDDALLVRAKHQIFKKKRGLVDWICIYSLLIKIGLWFWLI